MSPFRGMFLVSGDVCWDMLHAMHACCMQQQVWTAGWLTIVTGADYPPGAAKSTFKGTSRDYINLYTPAAKLMRKTAPDSLIGGPALAYNILGDPLRPDSPSGLGLVQAAASKSLPLDFFSFHVLSPCIDAPGCDVTKV